MGERIIKTGLGPRYKDMLDSVIGQMSDGYWENTPMMRGYWKFVTTGTSGNEVTLNVDAASGARDGDRRVENRFYGMSDDAVKKFFADKIKFLIKEEGLGKWARDNEETTEYLSYRDPYRVKDCYYAYEVLKGRNARKHPEYGDVAESHKTGIKLIKKTNEAKALPLAYAKWLNQAVTRIDDIVIAEVEEQQGDPNSTYSDNDMLMTADTAIRDILAENFPSVSPRVASPLRDIVAKDLAREWINWAYAQWYTGDVPQHINMEHLMALVQEN